MPDPLDQLPACRVVDNRGKSIYRVGAKGLKIVEELAARGCNITTIARALRMSRDSFIAVRRRQPEVEEAYIRGLAVEHDALVSNLRTMADDGNLVANIFLLKSRHAYREGEPMEVNLNVSTGGVLVVPERLSVEDYLAQKRSDGELEGPGEMIDVTPALPDDDHHPTGTRITRRGD
ncbi:hypothetical protein [Paracoccus sp. SJTW-4]|uniref:hypothetical protein n=1 Tax=Paracoccus sp. SJTW-4 TaxID=3078428 RepID=UPI0039ECF103